MSAVSVALTALTTYLLLDRNHAEEVGGGARIAADAALVLSRPGYLLPLALVLVASGAVACVLTPARPDGARSRAR
jgi:hypothetical protein